MPWPSTTESPLAGLMLPTATMVSPTIRTAPAAGGEPVPSMICTLVMVVPGGPEAVWHADNRAMAARAVRNGLTVEPEARGEFTMLPGDGTLASKVAAMRAATYLLGQTMLIPLAAGVAEDHPASYRDW